MPLSDADRLHREATGDDNFLLRTERRLQPFEMTTIRRKTGILAEYIIAGIVNRSQLLEHVAVLTRPKPRPNPRGD